MSHIHNIIDTGNRFVINPELRTITTKTSELILTQGDHNSKRYTFEAPRIIEGHDMTLCNRIEIHYDNISRNKKELSEGFYIADDLTVDGDAIVFTWLISGNVTRLAGSVQFWINFICVDEDGELIYSWGTDVFKGVRVIANNRNTEEVIRTFPDVLEQWKQEVIDEVANFGENRISYVESPDESGKTICLRDLNSGIYVMLGTFVPYEGSETSFSFTNNTFASVTREDSVSHMQVLSAKDNTMRYLEISDNSIHSRDVVLNNIPDEDRVYEMINESLGVIENGSY